jgi:hypothetical protein
MENTLRLMLTPENVGPSTDAASSSAAKLIYGLARRKTVLSTSLIPTSMSQMSPALSYSEMMSGEEIWVAKESSLLGVLIYFNGRSSFLGTN